MAVPPGRPNWIHSPYAGASVTPATTGSKGGRPLGSGRIRNARRCVRRGRPLGRGAQEAVAAWSGRRWRPWGGVWVSSGAAWPRCLPWGSLAPAASCGRASVVLVRVWDMWEVTPSNRCVRCTGGRPRSQLATTSRRRQYVPRKRPAGERNARLPQPPHEFNQSADLGPSGVDGAGGADGPGGIGGIGGVARGGRVVPAAAVRGAWRCRTPAWGWVRVRARV